MNDLNENNNVNASEIMTDTNVLYQAYLKAKKNSSKKAAVQQYSWNYLQNIAEARQELKDQNYISHKGNEFILNERGRIRNIRSNPFYDRVIRRAFCDEILVPQLAHYLIHDSGASLKNKGVSFTRRRFEQHLHEYYRKYGSEGYILILDNSKHFDNIRHDVIMNLVQRYINDPYTLWLLRVILDNFRFDVSYLSDEEIKKRMKEKINGMDYMNIDPKLLTGEKYLCKSLGIGDQTSQILGVFVSVAIDNYCKIAKGIRWYGRYNDDAYILSPDKEFLHQMINEIDKESKKYGIFLNRKKTQIHKLDRFFTFLQMRYKLTATGHLVIKINPKRVTTERRKLKKLAVRVDQGEIPYIFVQNQYKSWREQNKKYMSKIQLKHMDELYNLLFIKPFIKGNYVIYKRK